MTIGFLMFGYVNGSVDFKPNSRCGGGHYTYVNGEVWTMNHQHITHRHPNKTTDEIRAAKAAEKSCFTCKKNITIDEEPLTHEKCGTWCEAAKQRKLEKHPEITCCCEFNSVQNSCEIFYYKRLDTLGNSGYDERWKSSIMW